MCVVPIQALSQACLVGSQSADATTGDAAGLETDVVEMTKRRNLAALLRRSEGLHGD